MPRLIVLGDRDDRHLTHREIDATLALLAGEVDAGWVATDGPAARRLDGVDMVWIASGGPYRDDDAVLAAVDHCLDTGTPLLGGVELALLTWDDLLRFSWVGQHHE